MIDTKKAPRPRGRPRAFDIEAALDTAQALFQAQGYDAVGVAALAEAMHVNPPSFYSAFGSKAGLFDRVLQRYSSSDSALPLDDILAEGRDTAEALAELLDEAARIYSATPEATGCLVLEAARMSGDAECRTMAQNYRAQSHARIHAFIAASHPHTADDVTDFVDTMLSGLSAGAREGWSHERLAGAARIAAAAIRASLH